MLRMRTCDRTWKRIKREMIANKHDSKQKQMYFSSRHRRKYKKHEILIRDYVR
jgi:hypothetical protein